MESVPVLFRAREQPAKSVSIGAKAGFPSDILDKAGSLWAMLGRHFFLGAHEESRYFPAPRCVVSAKVAVLSQLVVAC